MPKEAVGQFVLCATGKCVAMWSLEEISHLVRRVWESVQFNSASIRQDSEMPLVNDSPQ